MVVQYFARKRLLLGAATLFLLGPIPSTPCSGEEGFVLSAASSPSLAIGFEKGWLGVYLGTGFRWQEELGESVVPDPVNGGLTRTDTRQSVTVIAPSLSLRVLSSSASLPGYVTVQVEKDVAVASSATYDGDSNAGVEELLKSQNSTLSFSGSLGARLPLSDRFLIGGEVGVLFRHRRVEIPPSLRFESWDETNGVDSFFRLTMFMYL